MARRIGGVEGEGRADLTARAVLTEELLPQLRPIRIVGAGTCRRRYDGVETLGRGLPAGPDVVGLGALVCAVLVCAVGEQSEIVADDVFELGLGEVLTGTKI